MRENGFDNTGFVCAIIDTMYSKQSNVMSRMISEHRHFKTFFLLNSSFPQSTFPPQLRSCFDYVFIAREPNTNTRKKLFEQYGDMFPSFASFCDVLDETTTDYGCMVIDQRIKRGINPSNVKSVIEECVYWYKPQKRESFSLLAPTSILHPIVTVPVVQSVPQKEEIPVVEAIPVVETIPVAETVLQTSPTCKSDAKVFFIEE